MWLRKREMLPGRACALLVAFCCLWLGTFGSFLHTDAVVIETPRSGHSMANANFVRSVSERGEKAQVSENASSHRPDHCLMCEWQASLLSPSLSVFTVVPPSHKAAPVVTTLARYLGETPLFSDARAPPIA